MAAMPIQAEKLRKIAMPPRRGKGVEWRWRSWVGTATHPRDIAKSRTYRVSTKANNRAEKNNPKQMTVNYATSTHTTAVSACKLRTLSGSIAAISGRLLVSVLIPVDDKGATNVAVPDWDLQSVRRKNLWKTKEMAEGLRGSSLFRCAKLLFKIHLPKSGAI